MLESAEKRRAYKAVIYRILKRYMNTYPRAVILFGGDFNLKTNSPVWMDTIGWTMKSLGCHHFGIGNNRQHFDSIDNIFATDKNLKVSNSEMLGKFSLSDHNFLRVDIQWD